MSIRTNTARASYVSVPDVAAHRLTGSWTVFLCARFDSVANGDIVTLLSKGDNDATTLGSYFVTLTATVNVASSRPSVTAAVSFGFRTAAGAEKVGSGTVTAYVGQWFTLALIKDVGTGDMTCLSVAREEPRTDGPSTFSSSTVTPAVAATGNASTEPLRIGAGCTTASVATRIGYVSISEVRIYGAAFTQAQIETTLRQRIQPNATSLVAYYRCDEGAGGMGGSTLYDRDSGSHNDGTLINGCEWSDEPTDLAYFRYGLDSAANCIIQHGIIGWHSATLRPDCTITASEDASGYPASNLRCPRAATTWRTSNATGAKTIVFGTTEPTSMLAITFTHNLSSSAVITAEFNHTDSWGSPDVTESIAFYPGVIRHVLPRQLQYAYRRLTITDANASGGYIEIGALHWWTCWEFPQAPMITDESVSYRDPSAALETPHRHRVTRTLTVSQDMGISFGQLRRNHALELRRILRELAGGAPMFLCPDVARGLYGRSVYGYLAGPVSETAADAAWTRVEVRGIAAQADR